MRVLMLGWEFPPLITGGLGTACYGLTKALSNRQAKITFILPQDVNADCRSHVRLLGARATTPMSADRYRDTNATNTHGLDTSAFATVSFRPVPSRIISPYAKAASSAGTTRSHTTGILHQDEYAGDLMEQVEHYARLCLEVAREVEFDIIHAHDWLTFPAGQAIAAATCKPLIVHVHSTEFDRAGRNIHQPLFEIEKRGMHAAARVVVVSHRTQSIVETRYGIPPGKIKVIYNAAENGHPTASTSLKPIHATDKVVLYLGRITMQKGPEYFIAAAKKVLERMDHVKFLMAGTGDMTRPMIELAAQYGIGHRVLFTGFLHGADVERVFRMADVYVMPSVSEPFGIAALEAIQHDVPVILSKTSGASEVLRHVLKVDFWDTEQIADRIIAVLRRPPLAATLRQHADIEARRLTWDDAAHKCLHVYDEALGARQPPRTKYPLPTRVTNPLDTLDRGA